MEVRTILRQKGGDVFAVSPSDSIRTVVEALGAHNIGAVVVQDEVGAPVGILSERDVVRRLRERGVGALDGMARDCMTADPFTCGPDASVDAVMSEMTTRRIRHIPVVEGGRMVGLVSIGDVVKRKIEHAEKEAEDLKMYISS